MTRAGKHATGVANGPKRGPYVVRHRSQGSLSNSVFERRTSTGSGRLASLGGGLVETLR